MRSAAIYLAFVLAAAVALPSAALAQTEVDLELVLAVDVSRSMDVDELHVQRQGYIAAFRHPDVLAAIRSGPIGGIAVTYVEWSGPQSQVTVVPWILINSEEAAQAFATRLSASTQGLGCSPVGRDNPRPRLIVKRGPTASGFHRHSDRLRARNRRAPPHAPGRCR
jgi:hypothetical protein